MSRTRPGGAAEGGRHDTDDRLEQTALPEWIVRSLADNGIKRLSELSAMSDAQLLDLRGIGRRSVDLLRAELKRLGLDHSAAPSS